MRVQIGSPKKECLKRMAAPEGTCAGAYDSLRPVLVFFAKAACFCNDSYRTSAGFLPREYKRPIIKLKSRPATGRHHGALRSLSAH